MTDVPTSKPAVGDFRAPSHGMSWSDLNAEWAAIQARFRARVEQDIDPDSERRRAVRWVLVQSFGDFVKFHYDAEFHARVVAAEQMVGLLHDIEQAARTASANGGCE